MKAIYLSAAAMTAVMLSSAAATAESLTLYCAADEAWCQQIKTGFEEKTGITVDMTRKSSGETYAQVRAEAGNPKGDVWWGGTGDPRNDRRTDLHAAAACETNPSSAQLLMRTVCTAFVE